MNYLLFQFLLARYFLFVNFVLFIFSYFSKFFSNRKYILWSWKHNSSFRNNRCSRICHKVCLLKTLFNLNFLHFRFFIKSATTVRCAAPTLIIGNYTVSVSLNGGQRYTNETNIIFRINTNVKQSTAFFITFTYTFSFISIQF